MNIEQDTDTAKLGKEKLYKKKNDIREKKYQGEARETSCLSLSIVQGPVVESQIKLILVNVNFDSSIFTNP